MVTASLFFFSSRRRHTRWPRDWSSDVCSSDLAVLAEFMGELPGQADLTGFGGSISLDAGQADPQAGAAGDVDDAASRSEERRVGKEREARWRQRQENTENRREAAADQSEQDTR